MNGPEFPIDDYQTFEKIFTHPIQNEPKIEKK